MNAEIYAVATLGKGHLSVMAHPSGAPDLEAELLGLRSKGVDHVVSLLEPDEAEDMDLADEGMFCRKLGLRFTSFPIPDFDIPPDRDEALELVETLHRRIADGEHIVIHCRAGIGRTGLIASALLVRDGLTPGAAMHEVSFARGGPAPQTSAQVAWVESLREQTPTRPE